MNDTAANLAEYPQHRNQSPGCGFPIAKLVVIFSLQKGAVVAACIAPFDWSEIVMSRLLYRDLDERGCVVSRLCLRQLCGFSFGATARARMQCFALPHARQTDFRARQKTGETIKSCGTSQGSGLCT